MPTAIALFAEAVRPTPRPVADAHAQALGELVARRRQLVEMIGQERTAAARPAPGVVQRSLAATLKVLEAAARRPRPRHRRRGPRLPRLARRRRPAHLGARHRPVTARTLIAELPELGQLDRRRSPPWSASRPSTATPAHARPPRHRRRPTGVRTSSTWPPSRPSAGTRSSAPTTRASSRPAGQELALVACHAQAPHHPQRHRSGPENHGKTLDPKHSRSGRTRAARV